MSAEIAVKIMTIEELVEVVKESPGRFDPFLATAAAQELATRVDRLLRAVGAVEKQPYRYSYSWHLDTDQIKEILSDDLC